MPTWTFVKAVGAPTGKITFDLSELSFFLNDTTQLTFVTSDPQTAGDAHAHPYLSLSGLPTGAPAPQQILGVELVDGVLSTQGPGGTYLPIDGSAFGTTTAFTPNGFGSATNASALLVPARARSSIEVWNNDASAIITVSLITPAVSLRGGRINPRGDSWKSPQDTGGRVWQDAVYIITDGGTASYSFVELN